MLGRLGLVIHWIGFLAGIATAALIFMNPLETSTYIPRYVPSSEQDARYISDVLTGDPDASSAAMRLMSDEALEAVINGSFRGPRVINVVNWFGTAGMMLALFIGASFIGWILNFILSGHKSPLPWIANKEAT